MKKVLATATLVVALCGAPAFSADLPTKAPPVKVDHVSPLDFTIAFGGTWNSGPSVQSSSGFYTGDIKSFDGISYSIAATVPVGKFGNYDVRIGPRIERMQGNFHFSGTAGGVPVTLPGSQSQWNYLATMLLETKISGREYYFGPVAGYASVSTHGTPCNGCPHYSDPGSFVGGAYIGTKVVDVGRAAELRLGLDWRYTASINNKTTDPLENFKNGANNTLMVTAAFTFDAQDVINAAEDSGFLKY